MILPIKYIPKFLIMSFDSTLVEQAKQYCLLPGNSNGGNLRKVLISRRIDIFAINECLHMCMANNDMSGYELAMKLFECSEDGRDYFIAQGPYMKVDE